MSFVRFSLIWNEYKVTDKKTFFRDRMFGPLDHIGIAVSNLEEAERRYSLLFGFQSTGKEEVESEKVKVSFFKCGNTKVELLEGLGEESAISKFVAKKGEGIHHLAFSVENIEEEMKRLSEAGFQLLSDVPKKGAGGKLVVFIHPKSTGGVLVELCQLAP